MCFKGLSSTNLKHRQLKSMDDPFCENDESCGRNQPAIAKIGYTGIIMIIGSRKIDFETRKT